MSRPWLIVPAVLLALACGVAAFRLGFPPPPDEQRLRGTWWVERQEPADDKEEGAERYARIGEGRMQFYEQAAGSDRAAETTRSTYRLVREAGVRRIELTSETATPARRLGVYDLRGDTLAVYSRPEEDDFPERIE